MAKGNKLSEAINSNTETGNDINSNEPDSPSSGLRAKNTMIEKRPGMKKFAGSLNEAINNMGEIDPSTHSQIQEGISKLYNILPKGAVEHAIKNIRGNLGVSPEIEDQTNADALGLKMDENGIPLTPSQQTIDAMIRDGALNNTEVNSEMMDRASLLDSEIISDNQKVSYIDKAIKQADELSSQDTQNKTKLVTPTITVNDIEQAGADVNDAIMSGDPEWKKFVDGYRKMMDGSRVNMGQPAIERLGLDEYYPDINTPLQVGVYSGSIVGSNPIFVAGGGYIPFSVIDARKRALEKAAADKAKQTQKLMEMAWAKGAIQYQPQIDQMSVDMLEDYAKATNNNFSKLTNMNDPMAMQYWKDAHRLQTFASQTQAVNTVVEGLQKLQNDDKMEVPHDVFQAMYDWYGGVANMKDFYDDPEKFSSLRDQLRSYNSQIYAGNQIVEKIKADKIPLDLKNYSMMEGMEAKDLNDALALIPHANYDERYWAMLKFVDEKRLDDITNNVFRGNNFYIGKERNAESEAKAKLEFKKYVLNMLGKEVEIQNRIANHKNGFLALARSKYSDQKKKEQIWTTAFNRANSSQQTLSKIAQGVTDVDSREEQLKYAFSQMGVAALTDKNGKFVNGEIRGKMELPAGVQKTNVDVPVQQLSFEYDGELYSLSGLQKKIKSKYADKTGKISYNNMPEDDKYLLSLSASDVIPGVSVVDSYMQYQYRGDNGKFKTVNVKDGADKWNQSEPTGTLVYGGQITKEVPLTDENNKQVYGYGISYFDKTDEQMKTMVVADKAEADKIVKLDPKNRIIGRKPQTYKQTINLPRIRRTISSKSDIGVSVLNDMWTGASKSHLTSYEQGEEMFYPADSGDNSGGDTGTEDTGTNEVINLE